MKIETRSLFALSLAGSTYITMLYLPSWTVSFLFIYIGFVCGIFVWDEYLERKEEIKNDKNKKCIM